MELTVFFIDMSDVEIEMLEHDCRRYNVLICPSCKVTELQAKGTFEEMIELISIAVHYRYCSIHLGKARENSYASPCIRLLRGDTNGKEKKIQYQEKE